MPTDEQTRLTTNDFLSGSVIVFTWIASDMGHVNSEAVALPLEVLGQFPHQIGPIYVTVHCPERFYGAKLLQDRPGADIAGMPDFVAAAEGGQHLWIQNAVSIRHQSDSHLFILRFKSLEQISTMGDVRCHGL